MNSLLLWQYVGWSLLAIILLGVLWLSYALITDSKRTRERSISLPSLNLESASAEKKEVFDAVPEKLVEKGSRASRRSRRNAEHADYQEKLATKSSSFFDDEDDEEFSITAGRD